MSRFTVIIGISEDPLEIKPGIFEPSIIEREFNGEIRNSRIRWSGGESLQDEVKVNHVVSIIGPETLMDDFSEAVYVIWQSRKWTVSNIQYIRPRINLTLGGQYNG
jgi:hypothetical protein